MMLKKKSLLSLLFMGNHPLCYPGLSLGLGKVGSCLGQQDASSNEAAPSYF